MKKLDVAICALTVVLGLAWFAAAEVVYDGSLMEGPFWRSGMLAMFYVPPATMYLVKAVMGEGRATAVVATMLAFLVLWGMIAVDVWVTHFKPNSDYCCIPAGECLMTRSITTMILMTIIGFSDVVSLRIVRNMKHSLLRLWIVRRVMRVTGMILCAWFLCVVTYWILHEVLRMVHYFCKLFALGGG